MIALAILFVRLGSLPFVGADEPRYARIAQEMQESGRWITPTLEHRPWLEKPPLYYWITIPFYAAFGVSETTARLGTALFTLGMCLAVLWLGSRLWGRLAGVFASAMLLTSIGIAAFGRSASTDMPFTTCLTISLAILGAGTRQRLTLWQAAASGLFLGLAILAKGPVALLLAAGTGLLFWLLDERGGDPGIGLLLAGLGVMFAVCFPWFWLAFRENGFAFVAIFFVNHNIARYVSDIHHHTEPFYYFLPILPGLMFPWCGWLLLLLPASFGNPFRRWREWDRTRLYLGCWTLVPLLFFSTSRSKLPGYILPSIPPLALLLGERLAAWAGNATRREWSGLAAWSQLGISVAAAIAFPLVLMRGYGGSLVDGLIVSGICVLPSALVFRCLRLGRPSFAFGITVTQAAILVLALTQVAFPAIGRYASAKEIASRIAAVRMQDEPAVTYLFFHHALHYYTGYTLTDDLPDRESLDKFASQHNHFLVVSEVPRLRELETLPGFSVEVLGEQGRLRLLRLARR